MKQEKRVDERMTTFEDIYSMVVEDEKKLGQYASTTIPIHVFIAKSYEQGKKDERERINKKCAKLYPHHIEYRHLIEELMKE